MDITIESLLYGSFIKYEYLDQLLAMSLATDRYNFTNEVDIYIVLNDYFKYAYRKSVIVEHPLSITSTIINMIGHYRTYFARRNVKTNFIMIYSDWSHPYSKRYIGSWNKTTLQEMNINNDTSGITNVIKDNIGVLKILVPYLPNIYFKYTNREPAVPIYDFIVKRRMARNPSDIVPNIIITRDLYNFQIVDNDEDSFIYYMTKKQQGETILRAISCDTVLYHFLNLSRKINDFGWLMEKCNKHGVRMITQENIDRIRHNKIEPASIKFKNSYLALLMALSNLPCRDIKSLLNVKKACDIIIKLDKMNLSCTKIEEMINIEFVYNAIKKDLPDNLIPEMLFNRFKAIDIKGQLIDYINSPESKEDIFLDLYDKEGLMNINSEYFKYNPIDLSRL